MELKIQKIITEHDSDILGLKKKNSELIGAEKKLKELNAGFESKIAENEKTISDLSEQIKSKADDKTKAYYENLFKEKEIEFSTREKEYLAKIDNLNAYRLNDIKKTQIAKALNGITFTSDTMKNALIALALSEGNYEPGEVDGETIFMDKTGASMENKIREFALSEVGRQFIANGISGGGGAKAETPRINGATSNPWLTDDIDAQTQLYEQNKPLAVRMAREAGVDLE